MIGLNETLKLDELCPGKGEAECMIIMFGGPVIHETVDLQ